MQTKAIPDTHFASLSRLETGYWWYRARVTWARGLVRPWWKQRKGSVAYADLGCGPGGFARGLHDEFHFAKVYLVDGDANALKRIDFPDATIFPADLAAPLALPSRPDLISLMDVIEH